MANYRPEDARATLYLSRRTLPGGGELFEPLKFRTVRYNVELSGESTVYVEPLSDTRFSSQPSADNDLFGEVAIERIEVVNQQHINDIVRFD